MICSPVEASEGLHLPVQQRTTAITIAPAAFPIGIEIGITPASGMQYEASQLNTAPFPIANPPQPNEAADDGGRDDTLHFV